MKAYQKRKRLVVDGQL
ncbi:hypothetical protein CW306_03060 [Bacillus sp. BA3]|nr:hypothetical protein CW306_03060 [Bacillus sp. BA3]